MHARAGLSVLVVALIGIAAGWPGRAEAPADRKAITITGRGDGPVRIVNPDGTIQVIKQSDLEFQNRTGASAKGPESTANGPEAIKKAREERAQKAKEQQAEAQRIAEAESTAAAVQRVKNAKRAEAEQKREEKIVKNYVDKEWHYGPNSVPEVAESSESSVGVAPPPAGSGGIH